MGSLKRIRAHLAKEGIFPSTFGDGGEPAVRLSDYQTGGREEGGERDGCVPSPLTSMPWVLTHLLGEKSWLQGPSRMTVRFCRWRERLQGTLCKPAWALSLHSYLLLFLWLTAGVSLFLLPAHQRPVRNPAATGGVRMSFFRISLLLLHFDSTYCGGLNEKCPPVSPSWGCLGEV